MNYIDTSIVVAAFVQEPHSSRAERWLAAASDLAISEWVIAELSAALSMKLRLGTISVEARDAALSALSSMVAQSFVLLAVSSVHFRAAARLADQYTYGLRAGDALHLAIAGESSAKLYTLDKRLARAGQELGIASALI